MTIRIEVVPEIALSSGHDAQIAALLERCFDTDFGGRSYFQQRHHLRILAWEGGLVSHVALLLRAVRLGPDLVDIAGLAEVATHPDHRGKGIAAALVQRAIGEARVSLARHLLLFGTANIYAAAGFSPQLNPLIWTDMTGARTGGVMQTPEDALMVLSLHGNCWPEKASLDLLGTRF